MNAHLLRRLTAFALIALVLATGLMAMPSAAKAQSEATIQTAAPAAQAACTYTVRYGDTLYSIAGRYHTSVWELMRLNHLYYWWIYAGQKLAVPCGSDDGGSGQACTYRASYVADITVPDGSFVRAGVDFPKIWRVRNTGTCVWGNGYRLHSLTFTGGMIMGAPASVEMNAIVYPGNEVDMVVPMVAPSMEGHYRTEWKFKIDGGGLIGVGTYDRPLYADFNVFE